MTEYKNFKIGEPQAVGHLHDKQERPGTHAVCAWQVAPEPIAAPLVAWGDSAEGAMEAMKKMIDEKEKPSAE